MSLADVINQELHENGPCDVVQINNVQQDFRPFVKEIVDLVRSRLQQQLPRADKVAFETQEMAKEIAGKLTQADEKITDLQGQVARAHKANAELLVCGKGNCAPYIELLQQLARAEVKICDLQRCFDAGIHLGEYRAALNRADKIEADNAAQSN